MVRDVVQADWANFVGLPDIAKALTNLQGQENAGNQSVLGPLFSNIGSQQQTATNAVRAWRAISWATRLRIGTPTMICSRGPALTSSSPTRLSARQRKIATADAYLRWLRHHGNGTPTTSTTVAPTTTTTVAPATTTTFAFKDKHGPGHGHGRRPIRRPVPRCRQHFHRCVTRHRGTRAHLRRPLQLWRRPLPQRPQRRPPWPRPQPRPSRPPLRPLRPCTTALLA